MKAFIIASGAALLCAVSGAAVGTPVIEARATPSAWGVQRPSERPVPKDPRVQGCFSSGGDLVFIQEVQFNARDTCPKAICMDKLGKNVGGTIRGNECWCGDHYPPKSSLVDDSECNVGCTGYGQEACGGEKTFTIYNTGKQLYNIDYMPDPVNTTQSATSKPVESTSAATSSAAPQEDKSTGSTNTAGIAAGAVVGVVAVGAIAGGMWFFIRKRRNQALEEEHRRNAAVNAFIHGNKPPGSSGGVSLTDSRMDPQMAQRRMSDGSIADNQDYSRRILRVTNA